MKKYSSFLLLSLSLTIFTACGFLGIEINENGYRSLEKGDKAFFKPFDASILNQTVDNVGDIKVYELNSQQVKACSKTHQYLWVHLWRPYCTAEYCTNIKYFPDVVSQFPEQDLELMLVSENYDLSQIKESVKNSPYGKPIFVMDGNWFTYKTRANKKQFFTEINNNPNLDVKNTGWWDDYFFKDSVLIFAGDHLDYQKVDSLMKL